MRRNPRSGVKTLPETIDWPMHSQPKKPRNWKFLFLVALVLVLLFASRTAISYWVDLLWFRSLGYGDVFWKTRGLEWGVFAGFAAATFAVLVGVVSALKRAHADDMPRTHTILFGGQSLELPVAMAVRVVAIGGSLLAALVTGAAMDAEWPTLALWWYSPSQAGGAGDPIFGRPLGFYLFTLPAWQVLVGWLMTLAILSFIAAAVLLMISGGARALGGRLSSSVPLPWRGIGGDGWISAAGACCPCVCGPLCHAV